MKITAVLSTISILVVSTLLLSCGKDNGDSQPHDPDSHSTHSDSITIEDSLDGLSLNKGGKWKMDDHTRSMFAKMASSFLNSDYADLEEADLKKAGAGLQVNINELIQGCSMEGDAHDQLHAYLNGYIPAVTDLSESGQMKDAREVARYLKKYSDYFE